MYLKSLKIENFRKFGLECKGEGKERNTIFFVSSSQDDNHTQSFEASKATSLIIGQNNSGKTTVLKALELLVNNDHGINSKDFNLFLLREYFSNLSSGSEDNDSKLELIFELVVRLEKKEKGHDLVNQLYQFICLDERYDNTLDVKIKVKYEPDNISLEAFKNKFFELKKNYHSSDMLDIFYARYLSLVDKIRFNKVFYNHENIKVDSFNLSSLINLKSVYAGKKLMKNNYLKTLILLLNIDII